MGRSKSFTFDGGAGTYLGTAIVAFLVTWFLLSVVTIGIYLLWVMPRVHAWVVENTDFASHTG